MLSPEEKARLSWHCRRGMLELDLIFQKFLENGLDKLSPEQVKAFDALLHCTDPELFAWLMGHEEPVTEEFIEIVAYIRNNH